MKISRDLTSRQLAVTSPCDSYSRQLLHTRRPLPFECSSPRICTAHLVVGPEHRRLICSAAAALEYGSLGDLGVSANTYVVLVWPLQLIASPFESLGSHTDNEKAVSGIEL